MKQVTAILIGAGLRGRDAYSSYGLSHPEELKLVAVAEPNKERRELFAQMHNIPKDMQFESYKDLLSLHKVADCAMVCTQDKMHYDPVIKALEKGYHVLCEKPMSPDKNEIIQMGMMAQKYDRVLSICHVLRYSPFFVKLKLLLTEGKIGRIMSVAHIEQVGNWHHAHSFVRGNWRNEDETSPMILAKCCHDMDILLWLVEGKCTKISSFGNLTYFHEGNAPKDAPARCMDGCAHRDDCPFYAPRFYVESGKGKRTGLVNAITDDTSTEGILYALKTGPYGRCVFHCDNNVVDHQVVNIEFDNEITVSFTMSAFTQACSREINIMGTRGQIIGNMEEGKIEILDFVTGTTEQIQLELKTGGHSGSDESMMKNFVALVATDGKGESRSNAMVSVDSHLMALAAEDSRITGKTIHYAQYKESLLI